MKEDDERASDPLTRRQGLKGIRRLAQALVNSLEGLAAAFRNEAAFRQELIAVALLSAVAALLPIEGLLRLVLILAHLAVLVVELLNSGIEAVVDKASPEFHDLAKKAKDMGSAAVLLALAAAGAAWGYAIAVLLADGRGLP